MKRNLSVIALITACLFSFILPSSTFAVGEGDRINMGVSPIRDEFVASIGGVTHRQVTFYNSADIPYTLYITTEDCEPGTNYGTPLCYAHSGSGVDTTKSSTWITTSEPGTFTIPPQESKVIRYDVTVPSNASPGGHYGAIFFNNPTNAVGGNTVNMNRRIGMLYLLTVPGNIVVNTTLGDILIDAGGGAESAVGPNSLLTLFSAPSEFFDKALKGLMMTFTDPEESEKLMTEVNPLWEKPDLKDDDFLITLKIPVENSGNTHIKPTGKIYLYDGDERLDRVGKQSIVNENGVYLGEKIVDFLPINDEGGNVLPGSERVFSIDWAGFAYNDIDPTSGKQVVRFESPGNYYSRIAGAEGQFLLPWEKLAIRTMKKTLDAKVEIKYKNPLTGLEEIYPIELPLPVKYTYVAKVLNWSALLLIFLILLLIWMVRRRNMRIHDLEDETSHLEDEISVLERASAKHKETKKVAPKKTPEKVEKPTPTKVAPKKKAAPKTLVNSVPETQESQKTSPKNKAPAKTEKVAPKKTPAKKSPPKETTPEVNSPKE